MEIFGCGLMALSCRDASFGRTRSTPCFAAEALLTVDMKLRQGMAEVVPHQNNAT